VWWNTEPAVPEDTPLTMDHLQDLFEGLIALSYPELKGARYELYPFEAETIRFQSNFTAGSVLFGPRVYRLGINVAVLSDPPPPGGLRAVLAHELAHTLYYHQRGRLELVAIGRIFVDREAQIDFERATDLEACARGFALGLVEYRTWIEKEMTPETRARYYETYYTPAELERLAKVAPETLRGWQDAPPRGVEAIEKKSAGQ
jgi:hypothetical protein